MAVPTLTGAPALAAAVADLADGQYQIDTLRIGAGTPYLVQPPVVGLDELPTIRASADPRPAAHGSSGGRDFGGTRVVEFTIRVVAATPTQYEAALAAIRWLTPSEDGSPVPLWFRIPGYPVLRLDVKPRRRRATIDRAYTRGAGEVVVQLEALDSFAYGADKAASTGLPAPGGGLVYPLTYPLDYGEAGSSGRIVMTNAGTARAWSDLTVYGPHDAGFELVDVGTGRRLIYSRPVSAASWVLLRTRTGQVLEQGTARRRGALTRAQWFSVPAGGSSQVQLNTLGARHDQARLDGAWSDTYWL